jgi:copper chaperone CopZ
MSCRVYATPDRLPSEQMLLDALGVRARRSGRAANGGFLATAGSVASAMLSSACCWLPLVLLAFGASAAGVSAVFETWRPVFIAIALAMLGFGFYSAYSPRATCAGECCAERGRRGRGLQRVALWVSAVVVGAFIFFPSYVGLLIGGQDPAVSVDGGAGGSAGAREYVFDVTGMHCEGCAARLRNELAKLEGVAAVEVDYASRIARLRAAGGEIEHRVAEAASRSGFAVTAHTGD